jgi:glycosyltransferase involved in cell wall biosynthesis
MSWMMFTDASTKEKRKPVNMAPLDHVVVVIPALNEELALPRVLGSLPKVREVLVIDNGSTDRTAELAQRAGATVLWEPVRGYGKACLAALAHLENHPNRNQLLVAFLDADFADDPAFLPTLVQKLESENADLTIGSRLLGPRETGALPWHAQLGNRLACWLMKALLGIQASDLGPYRVARLGKLLALGMKDERYGWTIEMQIKAARAGWKIVEIPVPYRRRIGHSKISGTISGSIRAGWTILSTIFRYAIIRP